MKNLPTDDEQGAAAPPKVDDVLTAILSAWKLRRRPWPSCMPLVPRDAANWWVTMQEEPEPNEQVQRVGKGWRTPYHDRLACTLRLFLVATPKLQQVIHAAREDGVWWRGEDLGMFLRVIEEIERMRDIGVQEYRRQLPGLMRRAAAGMQAKQSA